MTNKKFFGLEPAFLTYKPMIPSHSSKYLLQYSLRGPLNFVFRDQKNITVRNNLGEILLPTTHLVHNLTRPMSETLLPTTYLVLQAKINWMGVGYCHEQWRYSFTSSSRCKCDPSIHVLIVTSKATDKIDCMNIAIKDKDDKDKLIEYQIAEYFPDTYLAIIN